MGDATGAQFIQPGPCTTSASNANWVMTSGAMPRASMRWRLRLSLHATGPRQPSADGLPGCPPLATILMPRSVRGNAGLDDRRAVGERSGRRSQDRRRSPDSARRPPRCTFTFHETLSSTAREANAAVPKVWHRLETQARAPAPCCSQSLRYRRPRLWPGREWKSSCRGLCGRPPRVAPEWPSRRPPARRH